MRQKCELCNNLLVPPSGPSSAEILLVGEFPGWKEVQTGIPWTGRAGEILRSELARSGIQYEACRVTNLWQHAPNREDEAELAWHMDRLMVELAGRKAVLLMGSDVAQVLLGEAVSDVSGLQVKSKLLPKSIKVAVACRNPASAIYGPIGEIRLAFQKFGELYRRVK